MSTSLTMRQRLWRSPRTWLVAAALPVLAAIAVLLAWAAVYQPLGSGELFGPRAGGLPANSGLRNVNTFGYFEADLYAPPHRSRFGLMVSVSNYGPRTVTIESVSLPAAAYFTRLAGPVLTYQPIPGAGFSAPRLFRPVQLGPGKMLFLGLPLHVPACGISDEFEVVPGFVVTERFLAFTHAVTLPFDPAGSSNGGQLIVNPAGAPGHPRVVCAGPST